MLMTIALSPAMVVFNQLGGRKTGRQKYDAQVVELHQRIAKRRSRDRRRARSTSGPSASTSRRTSPTWPAGPRCARSTCGRASAATTSSSGPGSGSGRCARAVKVEPGDVRRRASCATRPTTPLAGSRPAAGGARSASTSASSASSASTDAGPTSPAMCSSVLIQAATLHSPEDLVIAVIEGDERDSARGPSGCPTPGRRRRRSPAPTSPTAPDGGRRPRAPAGRRRPHPHRLPATAPITAGRGSSSSSTSPPTSTRPSSRSSSSCCPAAGISVVVGRRARRPRPAPGEGDVPLRPVGPRRAVVRLVHGAEDAERGVRAGAGERPPHRPGGHVARPAPRRHRRPAPPRRSRGSCRCCSLFGPEPPTPLSVTSTWSAPTSRTACAAPIGMGPAGPLVLDLVEHGPARPDRRHERRRQERAAAVDRRRADPRVPADAADVPVRRLQGRRGDRGVQHGAAHRRLRHQPRRQPVAARPDVAAGRAQPPDAADGGPGQGPRRDARASTRTRRRRRW